MTILTLPAPQRAHNLFRPGPVNRHSGLDFGWASGDRVTAAAAGRVVSVYGAGGYNGGWGNRVIVEHAPGVRTTYNHHATGTIAVHTGQQLAAGDFIGIMGDTGKVTAKHLHFELYIGGIRVDPMPYFTEHLPGTAPSAPPAAAVDGPFIDLPNWWYTYTTAADARAGRTRPGFGVGPGRFRVRATDRGAIQIETARGDVWLHPKAAAHLVGQTAAPASRLYVRLPVPWFCYPTEAAARAAKKNHQGPTLPPGDYLVLGGSGPYYVESPAGGVWLGTGRTNPATVRK